MVKIEKISEKRYGFSELLLGKTFYKIEKVTDGSNYYCLWSNEGDSSFRLFNVQKQNFAPKITKFEDATLFTEICHYSKSSKSFVARQSNTRLYRLLYEDGWYEPRLFKYVGGECDMRPVMIYENGNKWLYYDSNKRKFRWSTHDGYTLREGEYLGDWHNGTFVIHKPGNRYDLCCYDKLSRKFRKSEYYGIPIYNKENDIWIVKQEGCFHIVKGEKVLSHYQWIENNFIFNGGYIFYKASDRDGYQIFDGNNCVEICCHWENIKVHIENGEFYLTADVDGECEKKLFIQDIKRQWDEILTRSQKLYAQYHHSDIPSTSSSFLSDIQEKNMKEEISGDVEIEETRSIDNIPDIKQENKPQLTDGKNRLPNKIEYRTFIDNAKIDNNDFLISTRKCKHVKIGEHICWIIAKNREILVTRFSVGKTHKIIYSTTYDDFYFSHPNVTPPKSIAKINLEDVTESTLIDKLEKTLIDKPKIESSVKLKAEKNDYPAENNQEISCIVKDKVDFSFNEKTYSLKVGDVWELTDAFKIRRFLRKKGIVAILLDPSNLVSIEYRTSINPRYKIIGEGQDPKFDQDFVQTNKAIGENTKRILLFKKERDGLLYFCDEVKCTGYSYVYSNDVKGNRRKLILFDLVSVITENQWHV